ncbi:PLC-like phosphodiesterase [Earliella scabrosa]|nr:PLC-like phosphodiesterase [Earliella scabrosa]
MRTRHLLLLRDSTSTRQRCLGLRVGPPADRYIFMLRRLPSTPNFNLSLAPLRTLPTLPFLRSLVCTFRTASAAVAVIIRENVRTMSVSTPGPVKLPECWGHRGASAAFPENTLASFERAIQDGAEGIESDVHVSIDDVVLMFHDPTLQRTTNGKGKIREQRWYGPDGMEHLRTLAEPKQAIPTFAETVALLMKPENRHVTFNIDVKVTSEPLHLFTLMHEIISAQPNWQTDLAPRILLGLWHPRFLPYAKSILPYCKRSYIGISTTNASKFFWDDCEVFSINFAILASWGGQSFLQECKRAGKKVMVWTVNEPTQMIEAVRWGVDVILTDKTKDWLDLREALRSDYDRILANHSSMFLWTSPRYYFPARMLWGTLSLYYLQKFGGPLRRFEEVEPTASVPPVAGPVKS